MTWYVYALCEPDTGAVRYIGKSADPWRRLISHRSRSASVPMRQWVTSLASPPVIKVLGEYESDTLARDDEAAEISRLRDQGADLLNEKRVDSRPAVAFSRKRKFSGIGERARSVRCAMGVTQRAITEICGLAQGVLANIEKGRTPDPSGQTVTLLARALDVSVEWLVTGEERPSKASAA